MPVNAIAPQTNADPSGVTIESSWHTGCLTACRVGLAVGEAVPPAGALMVTVFCPTSDGFADGSGVAPMLSWLTRDTASRLSAIRLPPRCPGPGA